MTACDRVMHEVRSDESRSAKHQNFERRARAAGVSEIDRACERRQSAGDHRAAASCGRFEEIASSSHGR
jgi:hypothetical protein